MDRFFEFAANHAAEVGVMAFFGMIVAIVALFCGYFLLEGTIDLLKTGWKLSLRSVNIVLRGWPPEHCDADGEAVEVTEEDEEDEEDEAAVLPSVREAIAEKAALESQVKASAAAIEKAAQAHAQKVWTREPIHPHGDTNGPKASTPAP